MKLSRDTALRIHVFFDQVVPPFLRDCRWFMAIPITLAFRHRAKIYLNFKDKAFAMSEKEFRDAYRQTSDVAFERETDLNRLSIERIRHYLRGPKVLEVGCGGGYLTGLLSAEYQMEAVDIVIQPGLREANPQVVFHEANMEALPFADKSFDSVVCTHTLEHVRNFSAAAAELRRVAKRVIVVVPRQRPYKYTFDLHLNFFPYPYSLLSAFGKIQGYTACEDVDGDMLYVEDAAV